MKINYLVSDKFRFIGSSKIPKYYYNYLKDKVDIEINGNKEYYDIVHVHDLNPLHLIKMGKYKKKGALLVHTVHSLPETNQGNTISFPLIDKWYYNFYFKKFDYLLAVSDYVKKYLDAGGYTNVSISYNAINTSYFKKDKDLRSFFRKKYNISDDKKVVLNVAQLNPRKGLYDFIEIAKENPDLTFVWVGGMPYSIFTADYFKVKDVISRKYNNLIFTGFIDDVRKAYSGADVFLTPSYRETFGLTIIEAASSGLPVITRKIPVFFDLFKNNVLYAENNKEFSDCIKKALSNDVYINNSLKIKRLYDVKKECDKLLKFYESIIAKASLNKK